MEHSQDEHQDPSNTKGIDKPVPTEDASHKKQVAEIKLRKLKKKYQKLQKMVKCLRSKLKEAANGEALSIIPELVIVVTQIEVCEDKAIGTQTESISPQPVATQTSFHI